MYFEEWDEDDLAEQFFFTEVNTYLVNISSEDSNLIFLVKLELFENLPVLSDGGRTYTKNVTWRKENWK